MPDALLTKREHFALAVLPALITMGEEDPTWKAIQLADALLADLTEPVGAQVPLVRTADEDHPVAKRLAKNVKLPPQKGGGDGAPGDLTEAVYAPVETLSPSALDALASDVMEMMPPHLFTESEIEKTRVAVQTRVRTQADAQKLFERVEATYIERDQIDKARHAEARQQTAAEAAPQPAPVWQEVKAAAESNGLAREATDTFLADLGLATWQEVTEEHQMTAMQAASDRGYIMRTNEASMREAIERTMGKAKLSQALDQKEGWTKRIKEVFDANDLAAERLLRHLESCYMKAAQPKK